MSCALFSVQLDTQRCIDALAGVHTMNAPFQDPCSPSFWVVVCASAGESTDAVLRVYGYRNRTENPNTEPLRTQLKSMDMESQKGLFCVHSHHLDKDDVMALCRVQGLAGLDIRHCSIETKCLYHLRRMRSLKKLSIGCTARLSKKDMNGIGRAAGLCDLRIRRCDIEPGSFAWAGCVTWSTCT